MFARCGLALLLVAGVCSQKSRFDNYKVYRVTPSTDYHVQSLRIMERHCHGLNFWRSAERVNASVDIMVQPDKLPMFLEAMEHLNLDAELFIKDVQWLIDNERTQACANAGFGWNDYYPLPQVYNWLDFQAENYPGIVSTVIGGTTFEGRQIKGVKVSYKSGNRAIFIESGIHAREWFTVASVTYILNELLTSTDPAIRNIAESFDWYIFPTINPDGYEYTHNKNRMWRKTRSPGKVCFGTDPNRNWDYHWMDEGASNSECSETFAGSRVFSEVETRSMAEYLSNISANIQVYLSFHSYGQLLMIPYGLNYERPENYETLKILWRDFLLIRIVFHVTIRNIGLMFTDPASGGSMDWVKKNLKIPYTFEWELRDKGKYGFILPKSEIIPTAEETLDSILSILQDIQDKKGH